jgi:hypothetical protein
MRQGWQSADRGVDAAHDGEIVELLWRPIRLDART